MKPLLTIIFIFTLVVVYAQDVNGVWKTIDDQTGEAKSHVEIFEQNGKVFGKVVKILDSKSQDKICLECEGEDKDMPILGLEIIKNMTKDGDKYSGGTITDPENGKEYKSKLWLVEEDPNRLKVRGYIAFFYRTQEWIRVE